MLAVDRLAFLAMQFGMQEFPASKPGKLKRLSRKDDETKIQCREDIFDDTPDTAELSG